MRQYLRQYVRAVVRRQLFNVLDLPGQLFGKLRRYVRRNVRRDVRLLTLQNEASMRERESRVASVVLDVAGRLAEIDRVETANAAAPTQTAYPGSVHWTPYGVAQGFAGHALFFGHIDRCFPDQGWDRIAHDRLTRACRDVSDWQRIPIGLYGGLAGLAFTAFYLSRSRTRYRNVLETLETQLMTRARGLCLELTAHARHSVHSWDLISGLSGVCVCLLTLENHASRDVLDSVAACLLHLVTSVDTPPAWHTPLDLIADESMRRQFPFGNMNCGLAHGLPGPLAVLALLRIHGFETPALDGAIRHAADWLISHRADDAWGMNWPSAIGLEPDGSEMRTSAAPTHAAWCYGSPGVARALWLAGAALQCESYQAIAVDALLDVAARPQSARNIASPTFCHGIAGLLQIVLRTSYDADSSDLRDFAGTLTDDLLAKYKPESLLGFQAAEGTRSVDQTGLLDGAPGAALALLTTISEQAPQWDRLFLLS